MTYYPFGATRTNSGSADVRYKYTGKELDNSTGLYFYEARYYDPVLGRFISPDTIVPNPRDPQDLNRYTYAGNNPLRYTDPTGHFKIKFTKFFQRALGDVGTALAGVAMQFLGHPMIGIPLGSAILTQSQTGRYVLAGQIAVGATVAAVACWGTCAAPLTAALAGAATGSVTTGAIGGYSAAKYGGDISQGVLLGTAVGAVAGGIAGYTSGAFPVTDVGDFAWTPGYFGKLSAFLGAHAAAGAGVGAASGATVGYAGGAGNWNTIGAGALHGGAAGAALGAVLAGAGLYVQGAPPVFGGQVNSSTDFARLTLTKEALLKAALNTPGVPELALAVGSGMEVMKGTLSNMATTQVERLFRKGGHCTYGSNGLKCAEGSGVDSASPPQR